MPAHPIDTFQVSGSSYHSWGSSMCSASWASNSLSRTKARAPPHYRLLLHTRGHQLVTSYKTTYSVHDPTSCDYLPITESNGSPSGLYHHQPNISILTQRYRYCKAEYLIRGVPLTYSKSSSTPNPVIGSQKKYFGAPISLCIKCKIPDLK